MQQLKDTWPSWAHSGRESAKQQRDDRMLSSQSALLEPHLEPGRQCPLTSA